MMGFDAGFDGLSYDVATAKALLAQAGYGPDGTPLKVVVTLPGSGGYMATYLTAVLYQWQENLGVEVEVRQLDGDAYFDRLDEEKTLDQFVGIEYGSCCWMLRVVTRRFLSSRSGDIDTSIGLQLELKGLSSVGTDTDSFLRDAIRGYSALPTDPRL